MKLIMSDELGGELAILTTGRLEITGDKGPDGDPGPDGDKGSIGDKGPDGDKGPVGDRGPDGDKGPEGNQGPTGVSVVPVDPVTLFTGTEQGGTWRAAQLATLFQDDAGLAAVTADGDPIGLIGDRSVNGSDISQAITGNRPTYRTSGGQHWIECPDSKYLENATGFDHPVDHYGAVAFRPNGISANYYLAFFGIDSGNQEAALAFRNSNASGGAHAGVSAYFRGGATRLNFQFSSAFRGNAAGVAPPLVCDWWLRGDLGFFRLPDGSIQPINASDVAGGAAAPYRFIFGPISDHPVDIFAGVWIAKVPEASDRDGVRAWLSAEAGLA